MPQYGGRCPFPRRWGGGGVGIPGKNRLALILDSLNAQLGTAYDVTLGSTVYARNMALARGLNAVWASNGRLANQWNPPRMSEFLSRWEAIYGIYPAPGASDSARRVAIGKAAARLGQSPTLQQVIDLLTVELGPVFVGMVHTSSAQAYVITPPSWPVGVQDAVRDWLSTVAYVAIQVTQPAGMDDGTFYQTAARVYSVLDPILPAWVTFAWFRNASTGVKNFILDDPHNLDNEAFGS